MSDSNGELSSLEAAKWKKLLEREAAVPKPLRNEKLGPRLVAEIRSVRQMKKEFLASLEPGKAEKLLKSSKQPANKIEKKKKNQFMADIDEQIQTQALQSFAIQDERGVCSELVDIGINIQTKYKEHEIFRMFERAVAAGTTRAIITGCSLGSSSRGIEMCEAWYRPSQHKSAPLSLEGGSSKVPMNIFCTVGVHPHSASSLDGKHETFASKVMELERLASSKHCVCIGECGLDYDRMFSPMEAQQAAFRAQIMIAKKLSLPLFVHIRERDLEKGPPLGAYAHANSILRSYFGKDEMKKVCVHCFTGNKEDLKTLVDAGYYIGFTGYVGMKKRATATGTLDAIAEEINLPFDRILLETDTPYMKPDKEWFPKSLGFGKSRTNEPCGMPAVCRAFSKYYAGGKYSPHQVAAQTTRNALQFFNHLDLKEDMPTKTATTIGTETL